MKLQDYHEALKVSFALKPEAERRRGLAALERAFCNAFNGNEAAAEILGRHMAYVYEEGGEFSKAVALLERICEAYPKDGRSFYQLAKARRSAGDVEGANEALAACAEVALRTGDYVLLSLIKVER